MNMAFDLETPRAGGLDGRGSLAARHPSWPELLARMVAAREASGALGGALRTASSSGAGSFYDVAAEILAAQAECRASVNPNHLGNRKSGEATSLPVAGNTSTGGRGK